MQVAEGHATPADDVLGLSPGKQDRYTCICCRVKFESVELQRSHFKTEWHLYNLKRKVCTLEPVNLEAFTQIKAQQDASSADDDASDYGGIPNHHVDLDLDDDLEHHSSGSDSTTTLDWVKIDEDECEELIDEQYASQEIEELLSKMIKSDTCLFCDKKSSDKHCNVGHMNAIHGFFIPEEQYLIDLDGLMDYLGFKVGAGLACLWCNKQFTSLHGVRLHMLYKDHCKILYDQDVAIAEYKDFYDYSDQEQFEMKPLNQLVLPSKAVHRSQADSKSPTKNRSKYIRQQLVVAETMGSNLKTGEAYLTKRHIKKFNSERAKTLLNVGVNHNATLRARFRHRDPI